MIPKNNLYSLKGKEVVIRANGIIYSGKLLDISEDGVFLRHLYGHSEIPMDRIQSIKLAGEKTPKMQTPPKDHFAEFAPEGAPAPVEDKPDSDE